MNVGIKTATIAARGKVNFLCVKTNANRGYNFCCVSAFVCVVHGLNLVGNNACPSVTNLFLALFVRVNAVGGVKVAVFARKIGCFLKVKELNVISLILQFLNYAGD